MGNMEGRIKCTGKYDACEVMCRENRDRCPRMEVRIMLQRKLQALNMGI
jgi:hypothetical protein